MALLLDYGPWAYGAEHSACYGKCHCFVRWHTNAPVWTEGKETVCSCMWSRVVWTRRWRSERMEPDPVGTSFGWVNNRQLGDHIVFWEEKGVLGVIQPKTKNHFDSGSVQQNQQKADTVENAMKTTHHTQSASVCQLSSCHLTLAGQMRLCLRGPTADLWPQCLGNNDSCC